MGVVRIVVLVVAAVAAAAGGFAATYYVDQSHPLASDSNPGSEDHPWLTIDHAVNSVAAGDTVWVKAGTYAEHFTLIFSGSAALETVFAAYPGDTVTIDGASVPLDEWTGLVQVLYSSYVRLSGFSVTNSGPYGTNTGIQVEDSDHVTVENNHTSYTASSGILVWNSSEVLVVGNEVEQPMTTAGDSHNECITVGRTSGFEVSFNHVHDNPNGRGEGICLKDGSTYGSAHHNHVHDLPGVGIYLDAWTEHTHDIDVYANSVHDIDGNGIVTASEQGGLLENIRVFNNISYRNRYVGIEVSYCCMAVHPMANLQFVNNSVWGNGWDGWGGGFGVGNDQVTGLVVRNNAVAGNLSFEITFEGVGVGTTTLDHNLIDGWDGYPDEACGDDCQIGDPLWVAPEDGDFHLQLGSPAIDNGSSLLAPADDLEGTPRPQGTAVDIGALEYDGGATIFADGFESGNTSGWSVSAP